MNQDILPTTKAFCGIATIHRHALLLLGALGFGTGALHSQTINWGSEMFSDLVNSKGETLDNTFIFELGSFKPTFTPDTSNTEFWFDNWQAFDAAPYNGVEADPGDDDGIFGYFTSAVQMNSTGRSESTSQTPGALSFEGLDAYVWIRNSNVPTIGSEWLLARATGWAFPNADPDCCGNDIPAQWSTSDLFSSDVPVWGSQGGVTGGGEITSVGVYTLQTATFVAVVPEPSTFLLTLLAGTLLIFRRRR